MTNDEQFDFQHSIATSGNPLFKPETHETSNDYFQLFLPLPSQADRLPQVAKFLHNWMGLRPEESLDVKYLGIGDAKAKNRFLAAYRNSLTQRRKDYYIDVDFSDGRNRIPQRVRPRQLKITLGPSDELYNKQYKVTLERSCEEIQRQLDSPASLECKPFLTAKEYVASNAFDITFKERQGDRELTRHKVISLAVEEDRSQEQAQDRELRKREDTSILGLVKKRIRKIPFFKHKMVVLKSLESPEIMQRIRVFQNEIGNFQVANKWKMQESEKLYFDNLRQQLGDDLRNKLTDDGNFERTYELMERLTEQINAFNIKAATDQALQELEFRQELRAHKARVHYFKRERQLTKLLERLDTIRYLADKKLDEEFNLSIKTEFISE